MPGYSKTLLVALAGALGIAFCPPVLSQSNQEIPGTDAPAVAPAPRTINLTQEQRFIIREIVLKDLNVAKARADAPETIGDAVPENIDLHPMPPELAAKVPQGRSHTFFVKQDNAIVLVSPSDRRVADVIH
ncbi:MAG: hypothetical protein WBF03_19820 [Xanthobacteraceae bacterium]